MRDIEPRDCRGNGVYVIRCQEFYKIGKSLNFSLRFTQLQTSSPFPLKLVLWLPCRNQRDAIDLEKHLHDQFLHKNELREWYKLDESDLKRIAKKAVKFTQKPYKRRARKRPIPSMGGPIPRTPRYHSDWYYWNWFEAYEPWKVSVAREKALLG